MEKRIESFNKKEIAHRNMRERSLLRIDTARQKIRHMHEIRAEKVSQFREESKTRFFWGCRLN